MGCSCTVEVGLCLPEYPFTFIGPLFGRRGSLSYLMPNCRPLAAKWMCASDCAVPKNPTGAGSVSRRFREVRRWVLESSAALNPCPLFGTTREDSNDSFRQCKRRCRRSPRTIPWAPSALLLLEIPDPAALHGCGSRANSGFGTRRSSKDSTSLVKLFSSSFLTVANSTSASSRRPSLPRILPRT